MKLIDGLGLLAIAAAAAPLSAQSAMALPEGQTLLEVSATGQSYVLPDEATLNAGVVTFAATSREAVSKNAVEMDRVVSALAAVGVSARDIQTANISLNPQYNYNRETGEPPSITGYQANNSVTVRVRDISKASEYLTALFEAGANNVNGPNFTLSDSDAAIASARSDAVANGRAEAAEYAAAFDMKIVQVLRVSERGQRASYNPTSSYGESASRAPSSPPPPPPPPPLAVTSVSVGEMQQTVTVWMDFVLEPR